MRVGHINISVSNHIFGNQYHTVFVDKKEILENIFYVIFKNLL